jgi:hypothetical protein
MSQLQARKEADSSALAAARYREDEELVEAEERRVAHRQGGGAQPPVQYEVNGHLYNKWYNL